VRFIKDRPGVRFVTATELMNIYADAAMTRSFSAADLVTLARPLQDEITFQRFDGVALSAADAFDLLTVAMASVADGHTVPAQSRITQLYGPSRTYVTATGSAQSSQFSWSAFAGAVRDTRDFCTKTGRIPDEIWIGSESLSPADYLATLTQALIEVVSTGHAPAVVERRVGRFTADKYVAQDTPGLWNWIIFPEGFHAPHLMELARLQAWTLKPAR
jgi:hypothetical protein